MPETLLTKEDAAKILNLSKQTIQNLIDRGELPYVKIGRSVRLKREDLQEYIDAQTRIKTKG